MTGTLSQRQLRRREAWWEGSRRQNLGLRNTNRLRGDRSVGEGARVPKAQLSSGPTGVEAAGVRGRSRVLPRETCPSVGFQVRENGFGRAVEIVQAPAGSRPARRANKRETRTGNRLGKQQCRPMDGQESAEAKVAASQGSERAKHDEPNRIGAFDV